MSQSDKNESNLAFQLCSNVLDFALWGWYTYFYRDNHMSGCTNNVCLFFQLSKLQLGVWGQSMVWMSMLLAVDLNLCCF